MSAAYPVPATKGSPAGYTGQTTDGYFCGCVHATPKAAIACANKRESIALNLRTLVLVEKK